MKAVLVIDIPNDIDISKMRIGGDGNIYYTRDGERTSIVGNIRNMRPLPQFKEEAIPYQISETEIDAYQDPYATGFNDAIRLIAGEEE